MSLSRAAALAALALALAQTRPAGGSVFELFGADARGVALVGGMAALSEGAEAAFYNPAALAVAPSNGMQIGLAGTALPLSIRLLRPICRDSADVCAGRGGSRTSRHAPALPAGGSHLQLGWHARHQRLAGGRLAIAALLTLPTTRLIRVSGLDAAQPHFPLWESLPDRLSVLLAASLRLHDAVAVGVGVQVLAALGSALDLGLDPPRGEIAPAEAEIALQPTARLTAGVLLRPWPGWRLGAGFRQEVALDYAIPSRLALGGLATADLLVAQRTLYSPPTLELGAAWTRRDGRLQLAAGLRLAWWRTARDPSPRLGIDVGGGALGRIGLDQLADVAPEPAGQRLGWGDVATPSLAGEGWPLPWLGLRAGYGYRPSPAPRARGLDNLLDNDAHLLGLGVELGFGGEVARPAPADLPPRPRHAFYVRVAGQAALLRRRAVYKLDPDDPVGDLEHGGSAWHGVAQLGARF